VAARGGESGAVLTEAGDELAFTECTAQLCVREAYGFCDPEGVAFPDGIVPTLDGCGWVGYANIPDVPGVVLPLPTFGEALGTAVTVDAVEEVLKGSGEEVSGGGRGPPLISPLTLRFNAGSSCPFSFFLPRAFPSFPP
jgi:hypothetical protein